MADLSKAPSSPSRTSMCSGYIQGSVVWGPSVQLWIEKRGMKTPKPIQRSKSSRLRRRPGETAHVVAMFDTPLSAEEG